MPPAIESPGEKCGATRVRMRRTFVRISHEAANRSYRRLSGVSVRIIPAIESPSEKCGATRVRMRRTFVRISHEAANRSYRRLSGVSVRSLELAEFQGNGVEHIQYRRAGGAGGGRRGAGRRGGGSPGTSPAAFAGRGSGPQGPHLVRDPPCGRARAGARDSRDCLRARDRLRRRGDAGLARGGALESVSGRDARGRRPGVAVSPGVPAGATAGVRCACPGRCDRSGGRGAGSFRPRRCAIRRVRGWSACCCSRSGSCCSGGSIWVPRPVPI